MEIYVRAEGWIRGLKARVGQESCISRGGLDGPGSTVEVNKMEESKEEDAVLTGVGSPEEAGTQ